MLGLILNKQHVLDTKCIYHFRATEICVIVYDTHMLHFFRKTPDNIWRFEKVCFCKAPPNTETSSTQVHLASPSSTSVSLMLCLHLLQWYGSSSAFKKMEINECLCTQVLNLSNLKDL